MTTEDFKREVLPLKDKIFRFAKRLMDVHAEAEDVVQEVFIKLWNKRDELARLNSIEAFAYTVTRNQCLDKMKTKKVRIIELTVQDVPESTDTINKVERANYRQLVNKAMSGLPEQQKMIMQLRDIEGYEFEEIEAIMGMNVNAIRVNLSRARKALKEELSKIYNYGLSIS